MNIKKEKLLHTKKHKLTHKPKKIHVRKISMKLKGNGRIVDNYDLNNLKNNNSGNFNKIFKMIKNSLQQRVEKANIYKGLISKLQIIVDNLQKNFPDQTFRNIDIYYFSNNLNSLLSSLPDSYIIFKSLLVNFSNTLTNKLLLMFKHNLEIQNLLDTNISTLLVSIVKLSVYLEKKCIPFLKSITKKSAVITDSNLLECIKISSSIYIYSAFYFYFKKRDGNEKNKFDNYLSNYFILKEDPFVVHSYTKNKLIIGFRGTNSTNDILRDLNGYGEKLEKIIKNMNETDKVKDMFSKVFKNILKISMHTQICIESLKIFKIILSKYISKKKIIHTILLTGHSLGGGLASILGVLLSQLKINETKTEIIVNSFGTAPCFIKNSYFLLWENKWKSDKLMNNLTITNYINSFDPVPRISFKAICVFLILSLKVDSFSSQDLKKKYFLIEQYFKLFYDLVDISENYNIQIIGNIITNIDINDYNLVPMNPLFSTYHLTLSTNNLVNVSLF